MKREGKLRTNVGENAAEARLHYFEESIIYLFTHSKKIIFFYCMNGWRKL